MRRHGRPLGLALAALLCAGSPAQGAWPGGKGLLAALDAGLTLVAGTLQCPPADDGSAVLRVEQASSASAPTRVLLPGKVCGPGDPYGLSGDKFVAAIEPARNRPTAHTKTALPAPAQWTVANHGSAWAPANPPEWVEELWRHASGASGANSAPRTQSLLLWLRSAPAFVARDSLRRLASLPHLTSQLSEPGSITAMVKVLAAGNRPTALQRSLLALVGRLRLRAIRAYLEAIARPGSPVEAAALLAIARIDGGLEIHRARALLTRREPDVRAVAVLCAPDPLLRDEVSPLVVSDPAPEVRLSAARRLLAEADQWALTAAQAALSDPDPAVRLEIALRLHQRMQGPRAPAAGHSAGESDEPVCAGSSAPPRKAWENRSRNRSSSGS